MIKDIDKLVIEAEKECASLFKEIEENEYYFSKLVLDAFREFMDIMILEERQLKGFLQEF